MRDNEDDPFLAAAFLEQFLRDQEAGHAGSCEHYQRRFPGNDSLIARQYAALTQRNAKPELAPANRENRTVAHYELLEQIGRGGQAIVYRSRDLRLGRDVALKIMHRSALASDQALLRFRREAEVAARLDHPGICTVLDTGKDGDTVYIAMRLIDGETLAESFAKMTAPPETREDFDLWARVFEDAARALHAAHEAGVVHRDIKPGNIMTTQQGKTVVLDFGLARGSDASGPTQTGDVFGTPAYMAPEQLLGDQKDISRQCDVYALGASLFECLTQRPPFTASSRESLYRAILEHEAPSPQTLNRAVPADLAVIALTALGKRRGDRYRTAEALADDLARFRAKKPIQARPLSAPQRAWRWAQRNRAVASLLVALFAVLATSVLVLLSQNEELQASLADARAGKLTKQQARVKALVEDAYQRLFSADPRGAEPIFDEALATDPTNDHAFVGRVFCEIDSPERALDTMLGLRPELETDPDHQNQDLVWFRNVLVDLNLPGGALVELPPGDGRGLSDLRCYLRGLASFLDTFAKPDDPRNSPVLWFRRAVHRAPRPYFHYVHGWLMAAQHHHDDATMREAAAMLEHHWPDHAATHEAIAQFFLPSDRGRAEASLRRLLELTPDAAAPHLGLATLAQQDQDPEAALRECSRGIEKQPDFAPAWFMRATIKLAMNDDEGARADLEECLRRDRTMFPATVQLARIMVSAGQKPAAIELLEATLEDADQLPTGRQAVQAVLTELRSR